VTNGVPSSRLDRPIALVLEDDPTFAISLGDVLVDEGFVVILATSIEQARRAIEAHPIAIVLVDLNLREQRGRHLLDDLAGIDHAPPMMIVSGADDAAAIAAELGVPFVKKPFALEELLAAIGVTRGFAVRPHKRSASGPRPAVMTIAPANKPKRPR
jgi:DNA-binding response OmpR family regulator